VEIRPWAGSHSANPEPPSGHVRKSQIIRPGPRLSASVYTLVLLHSAPETGVAPAQVPMDCQMSRVVRQKSLFVFKQCLAKIGRGAGLVLKANLWRRL